MTTDPAISPHFASLQATLSAAYGYSEFRPLQFEAIDAAMYGRDLLVVMPTGAGKSLCFQLPALFSPGITLVVSPLIALMRDQVDALNRRPAFQEIGCGILNSSQSLSEQRSVLELVRQSRIRLLYVAPERFRSPGFLDTLRPLQVSRLVIDEAHCISEWGHDFRPDYLLMKDVLESIGRPPVTAVTATATRRVQQHIVENLAMRDPVALVGGFNRPNLHFSVHRCKSDSERRDRLARALPKLTAAGGSGLIYVVTRRQCEEIGELVEGILSPLGLRGGIYHAGLEPEMRTEMQQSWLSGERQVLVCTNAFGMGIDKPDVRFVVHCACPESIESYYQEAGRAGRDGRKSRCVVLYCFTDKKTREWFIENEALTPQDVRSAHENLAALGCDPRLPKNWGTRSFGWSEIKTRLALSELERAQLIRRVSESMDDLLLHVMTKKIPVDSFQRITDDLQRRQRERYRRLNDILDYCKTDSCRRRTVLDYFGDREALPGTGFCCDNCERRSLPASKRRTIAPASGPVPMPSSIASGDLHAILQGLDALRPSLGRSRLGKLLRGTNSKDTALFKSSGSPLYGALRGASRDAVYQFFDLLIAEGLLSQGDEDDFFVCSVTQAGRDAWQSRSPLALVAPTGVKPLTVNQVCTEGQDPDADLFESLKNWRRLEASATNLPSYCIFDNKTLTAVARLRPTSPADLRSVPGIGDAKLAKYGDALLSVISRAAPISENRRSLDKEQSKLK